ncbi:pseudouridine synthase [Gemmatimonas sp.]|uniref:pseudouridine synthase n=1 Tax=Gemmatimonas sp. TaxID=1962908 RepID=UPI003342418A
MTPARRSGGEGGPRNSSRGGASRPSSKTSGQGGSRGPGKGPAKPAGRSSARPAAKSDINPASRSHEASRSESRGRGGDGDARQAPRRDPRKKGPARPAAKPAMIPGGGQFINKAGGTVKARDEGPMRVQRALARAGVVSRREADLAVAAGRVLVNGVVAQIGQSVDPARDVITLDGATVKTKITAHRWIVLNKPAATMTTRKDPQGRKTVFDLVEDVPGLVYVGRLDFMTEGVLLLTTDGTAAHALTHPSREVERTYIATVRGDAVSAAKRAKQGVQLEDGLVTPKDVQAHPLGARRWAFEITIAEGKTHEVRRICDALDLEVERLVRTNFGPVRLGNLPSGEARALTAAERTVLDAIIGKM